MEQINPPDSEDISAIIKLFATELRMNAEEFHASEGRRTRLEVLERLATSAADRLAKAKAKGRANSLMQQHLLSIPILRERGRKEDLEFHNIRAYTGTFTGVCDDTIDGNKIMDKILNLIKIQGMDFDQAFSMMSVTLTEDAYTMLSLYQKGRLVPDTLEKKQQYFEEFVDRFLTHYPPTKTPEELLEELRVLTKARGETLTQAVMRISLLVQQTTSLYPFEDGDARFARIVQEKFTQLTTASSLYRLRSQCNAYKKAGTPLTGMELMKIIKNEEEQHPGIKDADPLSPDMAVVMATQVDEPYYSASPVTTHLRRRDDSRDRRRQRSQERSSRSRDRSFNANRAMDTENTPVPSNRSREDFWKTDRDRDSPRQSRQKNEVTRSVDKIMRPTQMPPRNHQYVPQDYPRLRQWQSNNEAPYSNDGKYKHDRYQRNMGNHRQESSQWNRNRPNNRHWQDRKDGSNSNNYRKNQNQIRRAQMTLPSHRNRFEFMCMRCVEARGGFHHRLRPSRYDYCAYCPNLQHLVNAAQQREEDVSVNLIQCETEDTSVFPQFQSKHTIN